MHNTGLIDHVLVNYCFYIILPRQRMNSFTHALENDRNTRLSLWENSFQGTIVNQAPQTYDKAGSNNVRPGFWDSAKIVREL